MKLRSSGMNKCDMIREAFRKNPIAKNSQIKKAVFQQHGVNCDQPLIIAAIGRYKDRIVNQSKHIIMMDESRNFLSKFNGSVEQACYYIKLIGSIDTTTKKHPPQVV